MPILAFAAAALTTSAAMAGAAGPGGAWKAFRDPTVQDHGLPWSKVGDPHNTPFVYDDPSSFIPPRNMGRTNYKYRIMTREVTVREWFGFVQAYAPHISPTLAAAPDLLGGNNLIQFNGFSNGVPQYTLVQSSANLPMIAGWRFAARLANWLHNDRADAASAFESGVYDTSTFGQTQNEQGINIRTDQQARSAGARFFIPTTDEWKKAGFYDPDRYGEDQGGWWLYPITSDAAPIPGEPGLGGQTNAGMFPVGQERPLDVGSYPHVQSPWGLLDVSGGASEWMEEFRRPELPQARFVGGSSLYDGQGGAPHVADHLTLLGFLSPGALFGVRLASVIPSPSPVVALAFGLMCVGRRRGR